MTEEQVFLAALDLPDTISRDAYLDKSCGTNTALRRQVEALLASHFRSGEFLDVPVAEQIKPDPHRAVTIDGDAMSANKTPDDESNDLHFLSPATRTDSLGRLGHYEMLQEFGRGGFGIVFRAFDDILQRVVAVKVMAPLMAATSPARRRFLREARSSAAVRHENVVHVYEVGEQPLPYLVMEFIPGETLQQKLDRSGPLDVSEVLRLGRQIAEGLAAAHACDLIHRDIKPGNILLEGGSHKAKITDFGLARAADDASISQSGIIAGTPMFMAPEQALGQKIDQRADLFSLGSVLYQMVSGRPPFRAPSTLAVLKRVAEESPRDIHEIIPETPQWLCNIIAKLHAKNPEDRYQSAREVADVLADCEAQAKAHGALKDFSRIPGGKSKATRSVRQARPVLALALVVLSLVIFAVWYLTSNRTTTEPEDARAQLALNWEGEDLVVMVLGEGDNHISKGAERGIGMKLKPGPYTVRAQRGGEVVFERKFVLAARKKLGFELPEADGGFVPLFNGTDLSGWKTHDMQTGSWHVVGGVIVGTGSERYLFSERGDYRDFHLRVEAKINDQGNSGVHFRSAIGPRLPDGYEAQINLGTDPWETGSLLVLPWKNDDSILGHVKERLVQPDHWFTLEVIAQGPRIIVKVDGTTVTDLTDERYRVGHLALQAGKFKTEIVQFRKIEIKELPPEAPGWVRLFNGKDLSGWKTHDLAPGNWRVEDGAIVGRGDKSFSSFLFSESEYADFHLRVEAKINAIGDSGVFFRVPFDVRLLDPGPKYFLAGGYEAQIAVRSKFRGHTGSLFLDEPPFTQPPFIQQGPLMPHRPDEWFVLEVIAQGNRIQTFVNGKKTLDYVDEQRRYDRGHLALQTWGRNVTFVQFRKIEIKKLPASASPLPSTFKNSLGMEFVIVPKGKSWLGGGKDKLGDQEVEIPADFYLGKYEVTQEEWEKVMSENSSWFSRTGGGKDAVKDVADADLKRFPVETVSWDRCQILIARLNKLEKETGWVYRLPKEVEWEYACRGGPMADKLDSAFDFYFAKPTNTLLPAQAHFAPAPVWPRQTCKVGSFEPNHLGLFDMHGNVYEWCADADAAGRVVRGGGSSGGSNHCRATYRNADRPSHGHAALGLRLARVPAGAPSPEAKKEPATPSSSPWTVLKPIELQSEGEATLTVQDDDSILASGKHPPQDVYTLVFRGLPAKIHALRLEVLPYNTLPQKGPGRSDEGEFCLTKFSVQTSPPANPRQSSILKLAGATADNCRGDDSLVTFAIDEDDNTGWVTEVGKPHFAVFELAEPVAATEDTVLRVTLEFKHENPQLQLGCFRLSVTSDANAVKVEAAPP